MMPGMENNVRVLARRPIVPGDSTPDLSPVQQDIRKYLNTRTLREKAQFDENGLKASLMEVIAGTGRVEGDGHKVIDLDEPWPLTTVSSSGSIKESMVKGVMRQRKVTQVFDAEAALALVEKKGIKDECVETITEVILDEDKVLAANYAGKLTDEEVEALYSNKESFSFVPVKV